MRLHHVILFFCATASLNAVAQSESPDTLDISHELDEIVVTAPENHTIGNKTLFYPTKELKNATNNGVQLLAGLQIPLSPPSIQATV